MSTVPSFAVIDRRNAKFDVVNIVRTTPASCFDSNGTRWNRNSGVMYGTLSCGPRIVSHHATEAAAQAEATERTARAQGARRDRDARDTAGEQIRRHYYRLAARAPTSRLVLAAEVIERLISTDDATAERVRDILRGVE